MNAKTISVAILTMADEYGWDDEDLVGGLMISLRSIYKDDLQSSNQVKKAFCKFIDDTVELRAKIADQIEELRKN